MLLFSVSSTQLLTIHFELISEIKLDIIQWPSLKINFDYCGELKMSPLIIAVLISTTDYQCTETSCIGEHHQSKKKIRWVSCFLYWDSFIYKKKNSYKQNVKVIVSPWRPSVNKEKRSLSLIGKMMTRRVKLLND